MTSCRRPYSRTTSQTLKIQTQALAGVFPSILYAGGNRDDVRVERRRQLLDQQRHVIDELGAGERTRGYRQPQSLGPAVHQRLSMRLQETVEPPRCSALIHPPYK